MTTGEVAPTRGEFHALAATHPVIPVTRRLLADCETPVGLYRKLARGGGSGTGAGSGAGTFLLESAEHGGSWSRYSFVGARSAATLTAREGRTVWQGELPPPAVLPEDPLAALRTALDALASPRLPGLPPLTGGFVGYLSYDVVRRLERLPVITEDDLQVPELTLLLATDLAVLDHADGSLLLVANAFTAGDRDAAYDDAVRRLDVLGARLAEPAGSTVATMARPGGRADRCRTPDGAYQVAVERAQEQIRAGECFQIVLAQRFEADTSADPLDIYRVLRTTNPSPYMYLLDFGDHQVVGSSPEAHVKVTGNRALLRPIAGTRPRGVTPEDDAELAAELLVDPKERAEHVMLVDLGRNDLGRVCTPGSVDVVEFMAIERFSHVMHIVSTVVGDLAPGCSAFDVLTATFPAGTLSGAPKVRAMQLIEELEPTRRGVYGGTVGYMDLAGDLDMAIAIRTALVRDGTAYVQAGAGIVADSDPQAEHAECLAKAATVLSAVTAAETMRPVR